MHLEGGRALTVVDGEELGECAAFSCGPGRGRGINADGELMRIRLAHHDSRDMLFDS